MQHDMTLIKTQGLNFNEELQTDEKRRTFTHSQGGAKWHFCTLCIKCENHKFVIMDFVLLSQYL